MPRPLIDDLTLEARAAAMEGIRAVLTEENTDLLIARMTRHLPWWAKAVAPPILDRLLPDVLLRVFEEFLT